MKIFGSYIKDGEGNMDKKKEKRENGARFVDKSQEPYDYGRIEKLREEAWKDPEVRKNWEEFKKEQQEDN